MSKARSITFWVHGVVAILPGVPLLLAPGRFLGWLGWAPIDPIISRFLGSALLALAWSSFRGARAPEGVQRVLVELEAVFCILCCVGLLRHLLFGWWPAMVWITFAVFASFAVAWAVLFLGDRRQSARS
jgi:hypothetical protein